MPTSKAKKSAKSGTKKSRKASSAKSKSKKSGKTTRAAAKNGKKSMKAASASKAAGNGKGKKAPARRATQDGEPKKDKRQLVQERKVLRSQSRWLQKALFALGKAEGDQEKLAEVRGDTYEPMSVTVDGSTHELGDVTDSLRDAVMARLEALRVTLRNEHALMG